MNTTAAGQRAPVRPLLISGGVLGFGLGGFFDGIVLHQLLQWHHFISNLVPPDSVERLELNTLWDGLFHSATYLITLIGLVLLWRAIVRDDVPHAPRAVIGAMLVGAGSFNIFDSIVNHWILQIHHIRSGPDELLYDLGFFILGLALVLAGASLTRAAQRGQIDTRT